MATKVSNGAVEGIPAFDPTASLRNETPPPPPPPKDDIVRSPGGSNVDGYFNPPRLSRANSIYSLSRASFAHQLNQLTSLQLPDASSLSSTVAAIPNASAAAKALSNAAAQIQQWIKKAEEVLAGLDADDDVEWAAAGGRDGVDDVEAAIKKFEVLVQVWIQAIDDIWKRSDINEVAKAEQEEVVNTLDEVVSAWANVQKLLVEVKKQVELALEWEELWNSVLGGVAQMIEKLNDHVFEMEEKRHLAPVLEENVVDSNVNLDIQELQTIVEETSNKSNQTKKSNSRLSLLPALSSANSAFTQARTAHPGDSNLMDIVGEMQPLRASLDFLPMKLASYRRSAEAIIPTACDELDARRETLEKKYLRLQDDVDRLREELNEDQWIAAFRNADRQIRKLYKSLDQAIAKLEEALDNDVTTANSTLLAKKISDYEAKKKSYAPNLHDIIKIIDTGVKDRKTINGEVLRIQSDANELWDRLQKQMKDIDVELDKLSEFRSQQMRDSVSTVMTDSPFVESSVATPGSSPASSIHIGPPRKKSVPFTPEVLCTGGSRTSSIRSISGTRGTPVSSGKPRTASNTSFAKRVSSSNPMARLTSISPSPSSRATSSTPTPNRARAGAPLPVKERPRWNTSNRINYEKEFGHYKPLGNGNPHSRTLNGKTLPKKPSVYSFRNTPSAASASASTSNLLSQTQSSPIAPHTSPHTPSTCRPGSRAVSSAGIHPRPFSFSSPPVHATPPSLGKEITHPHTSPREYRRVTPNGAVRIPLPPSGSGSGKKGSLLPLPSSRLSKTNNLEDEIGEGEGSPTFKATLARHPATAMSGLSGRRSSMLPAPKES